MFPDAFVALQSIAWVLANCLVLYIWIALLIFVVGYYVLFDPSATTAGKFVWRFALSLLGLITLLVIGLFVNPVPGYEWWNAPINNVQWWRPLIRLVIVGYVAVTVTGLSVLLVVRKWWPHKLRTALDRVIVQPRHETSEIPIVKPQGGTDG
jgi:hypothetical protein